MSWVIGSVEGVGMSSALIDAAWQAPLALLVGTYALKEQHNVLKQQVVLGQRAVTVGEQYLGLSQNNYNNVTQQAYNELKSYFNRYKTLFHPYESKFINTAFAKDDYSLDYPTQAARVGRIADVQFANAGSAIQRQAGVYKEPASRQLAPLNTFFNNMYQTARVEAVSDAYRYEEDRQRWWLQYYWKRITTGANFVEGMARNVVGAVNRGVGISTGGISALGGAYGQLQRELGQKQATLANLASYWGSISNGAMNFGGSSVGGSVAERMVGGISGSALEANTPTFSTGPGHPTVFSW